VTGSEIQICGVTGILPGTTETSYIIQFSLPHDAHVRLAVFDSKAALVKVLLDGEELATLPGFFRVPPIAWNYTDEEGNRVPAGDYRLYFESEEFLSTSDVVVE
jgi:hypothetical protein